MPASRGARLLALAIACAALFAGVLVWVNATSDPHSEVVADSPAQKGWQTIEYEDVQVDIPSAWERLDMSDCEFQYEQWAPPDSPACGFEGGAAFYGSATFDPFHRPGVRRNTIEGSDEPPWGGYVYAGDFAVYASDADRDLVKQALDSARVTGSGDEDAERMP